MAPRKSQHISNKNFKTIPSEEPISLPPTSSDSEQTISQHGLPENVPEISPPSVPQSEKVSEPVQEPADTEQVQEGSLHGSDPEPISELLKKIKKEKISKASTKKRK